MHLKTHRPAASAQHRTSVAVTDASWDDLRTFLACVDQRSFRKAAELLGVTNTTVMRVIDRLEAQLGAKLFVRYQVGLQLTAEGAAIIDDVRQMERLSFDIFRRASQSALDTAGVVRVAVTEGVGTYWVMPKLIDFQRTYRMLTVDLRCAMEQADVSRLEADIAIQFEKPSNPDLIVTKIGRLHLCLFASPEYVRAYGMPKSPADVRHHRLVQQVAPQLDETAYARELGVDSVAGIVGIRTNSSSATLYAVERGAGLGALPTCALALGATLVPIDGPRYYRDLWLTYHPDLRSSDRHMLVVEWLKRVFDHNVYPCFQDEFIHPKELVRLMEHAVPATGLRGFAAPAPFRTDR